MGFKSFAHSCTTHITPGTMEAQPTVTSWPGVSGRSRTAGGDTRVPRPTGGEGGGRWETGWDQLVPTGSSRDLEKNPLSPAMSIQETQPTCPNVWEPGSIPTAKNKQNPQTKSPCLNHSLTKSLKAWGWRGSSAADSTYCSHRGPQSGS